MPTKVSPSFDYPLFTQPRRRGLLGSWWVQGSRNSLGANRYREVLPKLGLEVSHKRITPPRSGSTSETPTRCHSCSSPALLWALLLPRRLVEARTIRARVPTLGQPVRVLTVLITQRP